MLIACGTCGISILHASLPPFVPWVWLLLPTFVLYHYIHKREGKNVAGMLVKSLLVATGLFLAAALMLAILILPILFLCTITFFLSRCFSKDSQVRVISISMLLLFVGTGVWTTTRARSQGPYWKLTRLHAGSPGQGYYTTTAQKRVFTDDQLFEYLASEDPTVARNAAQILVRRIRFLETIEEAESFGQKFEVLKNQGNGELYNDLMKDYKWQLQRRQEEQEKKEEAAAKKRVPRATLEGAPTRTVSPTPTPQATPTGTP